MIQTRYNGVDENTTKQNEARMHTHLAADMMRGAVVIASRMRRAVDVDNVSIALLSVKDQRNVDMTHNSRAHLLTFLEASWWEME